MKLTFLGTRGYIDAKTRRHRMHTALLITYRRRRVMIDCGETWRGRFGRFAPHAIVLTHAHPDHAGGLVRGAKCPVFATEATWKQIDAFPLAQREIVRPGVPLKLGAITFEAFELEHSIRAPAVGYRVMAGRPTIFYAPDVVYIRDRHAALDGVQLYIGDGATLERSFVRRRGRRLVGHAPVQTQLTWCRKEGVPRAVITHCGTEIVAGQRQLIESRLARLAARRGIEATIAYDGMELTLR